MTTTADLMAALQGGGDITTDDDLAAAARATRLLRLAVQRAPWRLEKIAPEYRSGGPDESDASRRCNDLLRVAAEAMAEVEENLTIAHYHRQQARLQHAAAEAAARRSGLTPGPDGVLNPAADLVLPAETLARDLGGEA